MTDPIREMRGAEHMVVRILIGALWEEILLSKQNPTEELKIVSQRHFDALDTLMEKGGGSELFTHTAMDEMETFWAGVRRSVEKIVQLRSEAS